MMLGSLRARPGGWLAVAVTAVLMALVTVALLPSGSAAASAETETTTQFSAPCVLGPGILNIKSTIAFSVRAKGPANVETGQQFSFTEAGVTLRGPVELTENLRYVGASHVKGSITSIPALVSNALPSELNLARPPAFPEGVPFESPLTAGQELTLVAPTDPGSWSWGPLTVTGKAGQDVTLTSTAGPGFEESGEGEYKATGGGIVATVSGYSSEGAKVIGPLKLVCNPPAGITYAVVPITSAATTTTTTTATTTTTTSTSTTVTDTCGGGAQEAGIELVLKWNFKGSLTVKKLGQAIALPPGSTFKGQGCIPGTLEGHTTVPAFTALVKLFGILPASLKLTFTESEPLKTAVTIDPNHAGNLLFRGTAKDNISIGAIGLLGLNIPVSCQTSRPVEFQLESPSIAATRFAAGGVTFTGQTALPPISCSGGLLGSLAGPVISELLSGPNNPFSLTIEP